jgi:hypothetical protein
VVNAHGDVMKDETTVKKKVLHLLIAAILGPTRRKPN